MCWFRFPAAAHSAAAAAEQSAAVHFPLGSGSVVVPAATAAVPATAAVAAAGADAAAAAVAAVAAAVAAERTSCGIRHIRVPGSTGSRTTGCASPSAWKK